MNRRSWQGCVGLGLAVLSAAALALSAGGCPGGLLGGGTGTTTGKLTVTAEASKAPTTEKLVTLKAAVDGGEAPIAFVWTQVGGPAVTLAAATTAQPTFTPTASGVYKFSVTATDAEDEFGVAEVEAAVGDIQFFLGGESYSGYTVRVPGNPALVSTDSRSGLLSFMPYVYITDPLYTDREKVEMTVLYTIVSQPTGAEEADVNLTRPTDVYRNAGLNCPITVRPNPDVTFKTLTALGTTVDNTGGFVPGEYVFRATVVNPDGVERTRDLTINLEVESVLGAFSTNGRSAGPATMAIKALPTGSPGQVTDKVMTTAQTSTMTLTVFPSTDTTYHAYLVDNNSIPLATGVALSASAVPAGDDPVDLTITVGPTLPIGTHTLYVDSFSNLGQFLATTAVLVNGTVPVRFHVTQDFFAATSINAALVGGASNNPYAPTSYEGWEGGDSNVYGPFSVLADVNLDGAPDIITLGALTFSVNTTGFVNGSTEARRHPQNNGNFGPNLALPDDFIVDLSLVPFSAAVGMFNNMAVGDLNGDSLPDVAVSGLVGADGAVQIFFHTGDIVQPYSQHPDQCLLVLPPETDRRSLNLVTNVLTAIPAIPVDQTRFGMQIAIFDQNNDGQLDLVVTDPGFSKLQKIDAPIPTAPAIAPAGNYAFYDGNEGRVYVFAGGATGNLKPGRPDIITSLITERGNFNLTTSPPSFNATFTEASAKYALAYDGKIFDQLGYALAYGANGFAVGSAAAAGNATGMGALQIVNPITDTETVTISVDFVTRVYEFDTTANSGIAGIVAGRAEVQLGADNSAANALVKLAAAINADAVGSKFCTAAIDGAVAERLNLFYLSNTTDATGDAADFSTHIVTVAEAMGGTDNAVLNAGVFAQNRDGVVYRVATGAASGALTNPIYGTTNSNMGFGASLALGNFDKGTKDDDLAVGALDPGTAAGVNTGLPLDVADDGAVFMLRNDSVAFTDATLLSGVGATTLRSGGYNGTDLPPTGVGARVAFGDVNGDGTDEFFCTEVGFDRIFAFKGLAATTTATATTPDITFVGVVFKHEATAPPTGETLAQTGCFLFGDINGDTHADWLFLDSDVNFGFAGFTR